MAKPIADGRFGSLDLKKIKTLSNGAFEADVYVNGKNVGYVWDEGRGGCLSWSIGKDEYEAVKAECEKYREWCDANGRDSHYSEWEDVTIGAILDYKDDQKFAKSAKRKGSLCVVKFDRQRDGADDVFVFPQTFTGTFTDTEPELLVHALVENMMEDGHEITEEGSAYNCAEVLLCGGEVLPVPVVVPLTFAKVGT